MERSELMKAWNAATPKEKAEMVAALCESHPTLICEILWETGKCKAVKKVNRGS
jgi:hypothetical protein